MLSDVGLALDYRRPPSDWGYWPDGVLKLSAHQRAVKRGKAFRRQASKGSHNQKECGPDHLYGQDTVPRRLAAPALRDLLSNAFFQ